jgi:hypothetical protein
LIITVLASFTLTWVLVRVEATGNAEQTSATQVPGPTTGHRVVDSESSLPEGTVMVSESRGDVDQDGMAEIVIAFNGESHSPTSGAGGFLVIDPGNDRHAGGWQTRLPSKGGVTDLVLEDIDQDGGLEILLYKAAQDGVWHYLHIYGWDGSAYATMAPYGGPLNGMEAFASAYYPPVFVDVSMDGLNELLTYEERAGNDRLNTVVHSWNGETFVRDDSYYVVGPRRP